MGTPAACVHDPYVRDPNTEVLFYIMAKRFLLKREVQRLENTFKWCVHVYVCVCLCVRVSLCVCV